MNKKCPVPMKIGTGQGQRHKVPRLLAHGRKAADLIPVADEPVQVENAAARAPVEVRHVTTAEEVTPRGTKSHDGILPLLFGIGGSEGKEFRQSGGAETFLFLIF